MFHPNCCIYVQMRVLLLLILVARPITCVIVHTGPYNAYRFFSDFPKCQKKKKLSVSSLTIQTEVHLISVHFQIELVKLDSILQVFFCSEYKLNQFEEENELKKAGWTIRHLMSRLQSYLSPMADLWVTLSCVVHTSLRQLTACPLHQWHANRLPASLNDHTRHLKYLFCRRVNLLLNGSLPAIAEWQSGD